ncbi:complex I NDUFA9 subunit family protein [Woodsholea maritima]|uniref:complex I NDUFA9 subunit family protein n=1 Tax=Woodsholea maritima TaxID=240237 RepID=UPI0003725F08|nr:complex I NDUFA9 subunit family protein [Woodsholea maritima]
MLRDEMITVFGGSGFIGRYVVRALAKAGYRVRVATRRPHLANVLKPMGVVGQIQLVQANLRNPASIERALDGAHGVVNLVGILHEGGRQTFRSLQAQGAKIVAEKAAAQGITRFIQISAIGADDQSASKYAQTKAAGEAAVKAAIPTATILRPSVVFGPGDDFFNMFASLARFVPALPLIGGGKTRFQPVFAGDVAGAVLAAFEDDKAQGRTFELGGPRVYTFKEILEFILEVTYRKRFLIPLPFFAAGILGQVFDILGALPFVKPLITSDQVKLLKSDNVVNKDDVSIGQLSDLGIKPETMESIVPAYLVPYREGGQFAEPMPLQDE